MKKILLALALLATTAFGDVPSNVRVLSCVSGAGSTYAVVAPGTNVSMNTSPSASGNPSLCGVPPSFPSTNFVKTTVDNGKTWQWTYHLSDLFPAPPVTVSGTLSWSAPTTNTDGTALADLASFNVYQDSKLVTTVPAGTLTYSIGVLTPGQTYSFGVTAVNSSGIESSPATVSQTIPLPTKTPGSPSNVTITVK